MGPRRQDFCQQPALHRENPTYGFNGINVRQVIWTVTWKVWLCVGSNALVMERSANEWQETRIGLQ